MTGESCRTSCGLWDAIESPVLGTPNSLLPVALEWHTSTAREPILFVLFLWVQVMSDIVNVQTPCGAPMSSMALGSLSSRMSRTHAQHFQILCLRAATLGPTSCSADRHVDDDSARQRLPTLNSFMYSVSSCDHLPCARCPTPRPPHCLPCTAGGMGRRPPHWRMHAWGGALRTGYFPCSSRAQLPSHTIQTHFHDSKKVQRTMPKCATVSHVSTVASCAPQARLAG